MSVSVHIDSAELDKAKKAMASWSAARKQAIAEAINRVVLRVESDAKRRCPVSKARGTKTRRRVGGRLRSSITGDKVNVKTRANKLNAYVYTDVEYAAFVEFGTGTRGAASGVTPRDGYEYGTVAGMSAQPYLFPAVEENRRGFKKLVKEALETE